MVLDGAPWKATDTPKKGYSSKKKKKRGAFADDEIVVAFTNMTFCQGRRAGHLR
jgi:hypothetical protein